MVKRSTGRDWAQAFQALNEELSKNRLTLRIICSGGYVIQRMGIRGTADIDAFYTSTDALDRMIRSIGERYEINPAGSAWLNNAIASVNDWPEPQYCRNVHEFSNLTVDEVTTEYLMGMKLHSNRDVDVEDVGSIVKGRSMEDPIGLYKLLVGMSFKLSMVSVLRAFSFAYGADWTAAYYKEHSREILDLLNSDW